MCLLSAALAAARNRALRAHVLRLKCRFSHIIISIRSGSAAHEEEKMTHACGSCKSSCDGEAHKNDCVSSHRIPSVISPFFTSYMGARARALQHNKIKKTFSSSSFFLENSFPFVVVVHREPHRHTHTDITSKSSILPRNAPPPFTTSPLPSPFPSLLFVYTRPAPPRLFYSSSSQCHVSIYQPSSRPESGWASWCSSPPGPPGSTTRSPSVPICLLFVCFWLNKERDREREEKV